ncbi:MAG: hypothetical protein O7C39_03815 [Bacteroidetes bacterium]|nr:hypothetical protein [Bacteroidota bacterium]
MADIEILFDLGERFFRRFPMSEIPFPEDSSVRSRVLDTLVLIHRSEHLVSIRPDMPPQNIAFALCRLWFDHIFTPSMRYLDGWKGDSDPVATAEFIAAFTEEEYGWLERFHRFLELRIDRLSKTQMKEGVFPINDTWKGITRDAGNLLDLLDQDGSRKTDRLETVMRALVPPGE